MRSSDCSCRKSGEVERTIRPSSPACSEVRRSTTCEATVYIASAEANGGSESKRSSKKRAAATTRPKTVNG